MTLRKLQQLQLDVSVPCFGVVILDFASNIESVVKHLKPKSWTVKSHEQMLRLHHIV